MAAVGAGAAWGTGLPLVVAGVIGGAMFGVATVAGAARGRAIAPASSESPPKALRAGTVQAGLVNTVHDYRVNLEMLQRSRRADAVSVTAIEAADAARAAETVANRIARALDAIDDALTRTNRIAGQLTRATEVKESVRRMNLEREDLLTRLTAAVEEVGEVYAKLLELSVTADLLGTCSGEVGQVGQVSRSLDVIREVFADLEEQDVTIRSGRPHDQA